MLVRCLKQVWLWVKTNGIPFWGRCTSLLVYFGGDWDVHWGHDFCCDPWLNMSVDGRAHMGRPFQSRVLMRVPRETRLGQRRNHIRTSSLGGMLHVGLSFSLFWWLRKAKRKPSRAEGGGSDSKHKMSNIRWVKTGTPNGTLVSGNMDHIS